MHSIHPTAIVAEGAVIGAGTTVGPYSIIGPNVLLGDNNTIASHVVIEGHTKIGSGNTFFQFSSIGSRPQDLKFKGEASTLEIGDGNLVREYVTIQPGTAGGGMRTTIGNSNLFMANSHIGHDAHIGNSNIFANSTALAGHITVGNFVNVGGLCGIHQFVRLGDFCLLGAGSMVSNDVPPFCIAQGDRARLAGVNTVGLERRGVSQEEVRAIRRLFKQLFLASGTLEQKLAQARADFASSGLALQMLDFIATSPRGVCSVRKRGAAAADE
jgi:UDP-N-acetylglucosamine acyltransferase